MLRRHFSFATLLSFDLFLVPLEPMRFVGLHSEMIASYRLDNLTGVHACLSAIACSKKRQKDLLQMALFWDHEEIGSATTEGADSPFLHHLLRRIGENLGVSSEDMRRLHSQSLIVSVDVGQGFNPNYPAKYDPNHQTLLGEGVVLKYSAGHKFATDARTAAIILKQAKQLNVKIQSFANRSDLGSGSTVGPLMAQTTGIPTVDIGIPLLSMHAAREIIAARDQLDLCHLLTHLLEECHDDLSKNPITLKGSQSRSI